MVETINCPVCGEVNPIELVDCNKCGRLLRQTTSELDGVGELINSGQIPTEKKTAELEMALPAWLRGAREGDKDDETTKTSDDSSLDSLSSPPPQAKESAPTKAAPLDWLAGLDNDDDEDEEEAADWLVNIQDNLPTEIEPEEEVPVGIPASEEPITATEAPRPSDEEEPLLQTGELPGWLSDLQGESAEENFESMSDLLSQKSSAAPKDLMDEGGFEGGDNLDWLSKLSKEEDAISSFEETPSVQPDSLSKTDADSPNFKEADSLPDWMGDLRPAGEVSTNETSPSIPIDEFSAQLSGESDASPISSLAEESRPLITRADLPDWLSSGGDASPEDKGQPEQMPITASDLPDWMTESAAELPAEESVEESLTPSSDDLPDWILPISSEDNPADSADQVDAFLAEDALEVEALSQEQASQKESVPSPDMAVDADENEIPSAIKAELPDWLSEMSQPAAESPPESTDEVSIPAFTEVEEPDLVASLPTVEGIDEEKETEDAPAPVTPLVEDNVFSSSTDENVDEIFGNETPDWLSSLDPTDEDLAEEEPDDIVPKVDGNLSGGELPGWVQAMRPVGTALSDPSAGSGESDNVTAESGPLAGLSGILPSGLDLGQINKPMAHSLKLNVSESQQSSATILEGLLASESKPGSFKPQTKYSSIPVVRWLIAALLFLMVGSSLLSQSHMTPSPNIVVPEIRDTIEIINQLPEAGSALLVFDYEAAFSGEMHAIAAPLIDHLMLRGEKLVILSTLPTGPALAEHFLAETQSSHNYQRNDEYLNLGYLPGGPSGILSFITSPRTAITAQVDGTSIWSFPPLESVATLSDFSVVIVMTADVEKGRAWVEQSTIPLRETGSPPLLMAISAQAEPILYPYYESGQVDGLVSGLSGGATYERLQGQSGLGRKYWDSYSVGLLLAEILIAVGAMVNLLAALKVRQARNKDEG
ncbi:MAG: hypothetical protein H8E29_12170 [Anaerolineales bacterium]|uniref:Zinc ribbon domain-containing protein n=1 Tax=Candidatus Desulfolinea nitratireducens TaxID=2841698 RepID=A0A8J6TJG0_9CHLR|nr:hypothetical protein [Candidatus Desulfolinea nitratireducens]